MDRIRWAVLGVGRFGAVHARVLAGLNGVELKALCGRRVAHVESLAAELEVGWTMAEAAQIIESDQIDAVSITSHWRDHLPLARAALAAGKHVLLEKPMACDAGECAELLDVAAEARGYLLVGHVCRFDPRISLAKEAIAQGRLGRIVSLHAKRNLPRAPGPIRLDKISPLMGDGIHDADLMMWFLEQTPRRVFARNVRVHDFAYPDIGWAMLEFGEAAVGVIETNWCLPPNVPTCIDARMEVVGTEGMLTVDCSHGGLTIQDASGRDFPDTMYWPLQHGRQVGALALEIEYFADCIRQRRAPRVITPVEAARAVAVMECAEASAAIGQPVPFDSPF